MKRYRWQIARTTLNIFICVATAVLFGFILYGGMKIRISESPSPDENVTETTIESESSQLSEDTSSIEPSATPELLSSVSSQVSAVSSLSPSPSALPSVSPSPQVTPSPTPKVKTTPKAKATPTLTPKPHKATPTPTAKPKPTPVPTPSPTPERIPEGEQKDLLQELFQAFQEENRQQSGQILRNWYELWKSEEGKNWVNIAQIPYDGKSFSEGYTGTALVSDDTSRFYYGSVKDGVPHGQGVRLGLTEVAPDRTVYLWAEGEWDQGVMVGNAEFYLGEILASGTSEYENFTQITCTLDGSPEERFTEGNVVHQEVYNHSDTISVAQFAFQIRDGKLMAEEWTQRADGMYEITVQALNQSNVWCSLSNPSLEEPDFQNPYPWNGDYRYSNNFPFNCPIF